MNDWTSFINKLLSVSTFLLEIVRFMDSLNYLLILILDLFYLLFEILELLMQLAYLLGTLSSALLASSLKRRDTRGVRELIRAFTFTEALTHLNCIFI